MVVVETAEQYCEHSVPSFSSIGVTAPVALEVGIQKALCKDPTLRYQSAFEVWARSTRQIGRTPEMKPDLEVGNGSVVKAPKPPPSNIMENGTVSTASADKEKPRREQRLFGLKVLLLAVIAGLFLVLWSS